MERTTRKNYGLNDKQIEDLYLFVNNDDPRFTTESGKIRHTQLAVYCGLMWRTDIKPREVRNLFIRKKRRRKKENLLKKGVKIK